ncbi:TetR/AcrR family transcriptional regulator [Manganibacter manganicus]|uniref:TetR family transcriptional regulator n=1 Tax=Manganibacter manganicus TaxID=1873176 RepID=A0A1V8RQQ4_9HYPH|nr:TetR/AcrR family transcriptional regulator [Pseudaminobacter manganicus]OQM75541.1 TetR family transcriptional regulator [Pseudaminobacter manganicus]
MPRVVAEKADVIPLLAEVFREHGYEGATISRIHDKTGFGRGSLYHFFPGGKEDMAAAVLAEVDGWFEQHIFEPLRQADDAELAIGQMFDAVTTYFRSGGRVCLVGAFALTDARNRFGAAVGGYFARWIEALALALRHAGASDSMAVALAEDAVLGIQGAIVIARSLDDRAAFERAMQRIQARTLVWKE